tara:strand:- start:2205 stop:2411 length:207 start_codon:yes stop_codon:yes gene_type:complete
MATTATILGSVTGDLAARIATLEDETSLPVHTSTDLPSSPETGDSVFCSDDSSIKTWDGSQWVSTTLS